MDSLQNMEYDFATLMQGSQILFSQWEDNAAELFKNEFLTPLQSKWNDFHNEMYREAQILSETEVAIDRLMDEFRKKQL